MSDQSELHNTLSRRFVMEVMGPAIKSGATFADMMVLFETIEVAFLEILHRHYDQKPAVASGLVEASVDRAIERFAAIRRN